MKLAEEGRLQVEDAVIEHLPEFQLVDYADMEDIKNTSPPFSHNRSCNNGAKGTTHEIR